MAYVSRDYLREKWDALKWDIEEVLDVYNEYVADDRVDDEVLHRVRYSAIDNLHAIEKEISKDD